MIDRPAPAQEPAPSPTSADPASTPPSSEPPPPRASTPRRAIYLGPVQLTPAVVLVTLALLGSLAYIAYVVLKVEDQQIELLGYGFGVLGATFAAIAIGSVVEMWKAASRARARRALGLAILGGFAGLAAIGCLTFTVISRLLAAS